MDLEQKGGLIVSRLTKNQNITVNKIQYFVKSVTKKQIVLKNGTDAVTIKVHKSCYYGNSKTNNFFRSIESDLILDSINQYNPFHTMTDSTKMLQN